jgi:hypothetical protein
MEENMEDTIRVDAKNVNRKVGEAFKSFVVQKHGKLRGAYSEEVTMALAEYLSVHAHTHEEEEEVKNTKNVGAKRLTEVEDKLESMGLLDLLKNGGDVYPAAIESVIRTTVGLDKRTVAKYYSALCTQYELEVDNHGVLRR